MILDPVNDSVIYLGVGVVVFLACGYYYQISITTLVAIVCCMLICYFLYDYSQTETTDFLTEMENKLLDLGMPDALYVSVDLINLYHSILPWRELNADAFTNSLTACNNVLQIYLDAEKGLDHPVENYEVARVQGELAINYLHTFIFMLDNAVLIQQLKTLLVYLSTLINTYLQDIKRMAVAMQRKKGLQSTEHILEDTPIKAFDPMAKVFDLYQLN